MLFTHSWTHCSFKTQSVLYTDCCSLPLSLLIICSSGSPSAIRISQPRTDTSNWPHGKCLCGSSGLPSLPSLPYKPSFLQSLSWACLSHPRCGAVSTGRCFLLPCFSFYLPLSLSFQPPFSYSLSSLTPLFLTTVLFVHLQKHSISLSILCSHYSCLWVSHICTPLSLPASLLSL